MLEYLCLQMQPHTRDFFNPNFSTRFCKTYITQITQGSLKNLKVLSFVAIPRPCLGAPTKTSSRSPADHPSKSPWQRSPLHDALVLTVAGPPAPWGGVNGKRKTGEHLIAHGASACGASLSMHLSRDPRVYMVASRVLTLYVN